MLRFTFGRFHSIQADPANFSKGVGTVSLATTAAALASVCESTFERKRSYAMISRTAMS